jgi:hypothetical protein
MLDEKDRQALQELEAKVIKNKMLRHELGWQVGFDERQRRLIANCRAYAKNDPAGLPAHNLMVIIAQMASLLDGVDQDW